MWQIKGESLAWWSTLSVSWLFAHISENLCGVVSSGPWSSMQSRLSLFWYQFYSSVLLQIFRVSRRKPFFRKMTAVTTLKWCQIYAFVFVYPTYSACFSLFVCLFKKDLFKSSTSNKSSLSGIMTIICIIPQIRMRTMSLFEKDPNSIIYLNQKISNNHHSVVLWQWQS